jgi:hypothetical protein
MAECGAQVTWREFETDHAGIVMSRYDRLTRQCVPSNELHAVTAGEGTADALASAATGSGLR